MQAKAQVAAESQAISQERDALQERYNADMAALTSKAADFGTALQAAQNELDDTRVLLESAERREADMSASIDMSESTAEEAREALRAAKADLAASEAALQSVRDAKGALQAKLKAAEVRRSPAQA